jgi:hypothetical protein
MKSSIVSFISIIYIISMSSCSSIITGLYGMKNYKVVDEKTIIRYSKKYNIPLEDSYELDINYISYLKSLDTSIYKEQIKNHYQPLQALYYDNKGELKSFQINCYTGGFPNLNWERDSIMTTFPPKKQAPIDSIVSLETQIKYLRQLSNTKKLSTDNYDYTIVVYWNRFMGRQSKRLIRLVQQNAEMSNKKIKIIYVNSDNIFKDQNL